MCFKNKYARIFFTIFLLNLLLRKSSANPRKRSIVRETLVQVPFGETVTLTCESNDASHTFFYWFLNDKNIIIGPTNPYDNGKFRYEVLSGNLTVKAVSKDEEGVYNCVSRGVTKDDVNIRSVRMVVEADWEEVYDYDPNSKNKVLEEHCNLLQAKNNYYETKLKDMQIEKNNAGEGDLSDKDKRLQQETEDISDDEDQKTRSVQDRLKGVLFGAALPKLGQILYKIKEKRHEIKNMIQGNNEDGVHGGCPMPKINFKEKIAVIKVNLFRVVIVMGSLMILSGVGYAGYKIWKTRHRHPSYLIPSEDEEGDDNEIFSRPGASRDNQHLIKNNSTDSFDAPGISTDFSSILDTATSK